VAATVVSSTANQIIVTVPSGVSAGLISVKVGSTTVSSSQPFSVVNSPTITSFTPGVVDLGTSVTMTGTNLNPVAGSTNIRVAGDSVPTSSLTATRAVFAPQFGGSGPIQIATFYGQATSAAELIVAPSPVGAANIISSKTLVTGGSSQSINISQQNKYGVFALDAIAGQWLSVQLTALTVSPSTSQIAYQVYSPANVSIAFGAVSATAKSIHLPRIAETGTYLVVFKTANDTAQLTGLLENNATLSMNATPIAVTTANVAQSKRIVFSITAGQTVALSVNSIVTTPANVGMYIWVYDSTGALLSSGGGYPSATLNLPNLAAGTYGAVFQGYNGGTEATATGQVTLASGLTGTLPANGTSANYASTEPGQIGYFTFTGTAGQSLGLALTHLVLTPNVNSAISFSATSPDGSAPAPSDSCYTANAGCELSLVNLPQTGTYSVVIDPSAMSTMSLTLTLSQDVTGTLTANTPKTVSLPTVGQNALLDFIASAGQTITLTVDSIVTTPASAGVAVSVYDAAWNAIYIADSNGQPSLTMSLPNLAAADYHVLIAPDSAATASMRATIQ
jgi:hypothetical protein